MNSRILAILLLPMLALAGCEEKKSSSTLTITTTKNYVTGIDLDDRFATADSLVIVHYKDPFGDDSLRYTRYYKQYISTDSALINSLLSNINQPFIKLEKIKPCRSEGKIWMFSQGKIFQTIYFAYSKAECYFLYVIKDGFFYYMDVKPAFLQKLKLTKAKAKDSI